MAGVEVDPDAVVATATSMKPLAADVRGPGTTVGGLTAPAEAPLSAAFAGMTEAWSTALGLLAQNMELVADKVSAAAVQYRVTEREIHDAFTRASAAATPTPTGPGQVTP